MSHHLTSYIEREVEAIFGEGWTVIKFDEHRYYRNLSGYGLKGVDFLALHDEWGVVLIELKSYDGAVPIDLPDTLDAKKDGSIRLIRIIAAYYRRQLYYRIVTWLGLSQWLTGDMKLWHTAASCIDSDRYFFLSIIDY